MIGNEAKQPHFKSGLVLKGDRHGGLLPALPPRRYVGRRWSQAGARLMRTCNADLPS